MQSTPQMRPGCAARLRTRRLLGPFLIFWMTATGQGALCAPLADPLRIWVGLSGPEDVTRWVDLHVARYQEDLDQFLADRPVRTVARDLALYDAAAAELDLAGMQTAGLLSRVAPDEAIREEAEKQSQRISEVANELSLNPRVYAILSAIDTTHADAATRYYVERSLLEYRLAGADRPPEVRAKLKDLLDLASQKEIEFRHNLAKSVNTVDVTDAKELEGLPEDYIAHHKPDASGVIHLTSSTPDFTPVDTYSHSDDLRRRMRIAYSTRGYPENQAVLADLLATRQQIAQLLGYPSWPDLALADRMMATRAHLDEFLKKTDDATRAQAQSEYETLLGFARTHEPSIDALDESSTGYWSEQYRRETFGFDSQLMRPYFPYAAVEQGILAVTGRLFHVEFVRNTSMPVWDPSVSVWDVIERDAKSPRKGQRIGRVYLDMHPREGKDQWFNSGSVIPGIAGKQLPEGRLVCNFPGGKDGDPGLLQFNNVQTFFHELGHLMHSILGGFQRYEGISGISTERDFVEAPSQMLEELIHAPTVLQSFGRHYQTGAVIPTDLIARMNRSSQFGRARWARAQLRYSAYALDLHAGGPGAIDPDKLWDQEWSRYELARELPGTHMYASFDHLVGYSSNYYTYVLDKVIAVNFFAQFDPAHLLDGPTALRYRHTVLEPGGSKPAEQLVEDFLGHPERFEPFARWVAGENPSP